MLYLYNSIVALHFGAFYKQNLQKLFNFLSIIIEDPIQLMDVQ